jgi:anti-sigma regulatory factor (Ser/Thr protein kinase)
MQEKIVIQNRKDFYKLFAIMEKSFQEINIELHLEVSSLAPIDVLIITQFLIVQGQKKCNISISSSNVHVKAYIKAIRLADFVKLNIHKPSTIRAIPEFSAMPIRRVERESMYAYINNTERYFKTICKSKDLAMLNQCMSELINNVYDHSHSEIGAYVFCQYHPDLNEIKMAVSDYGIGIPKSVNEYRLGQGEEKISDVDGVKWAIKENKTTQSIPQNTGRGLDIVNSFMKKNKGTWKLLSGNAFLDGSSSGKNQYKENFIYGFKGTVVQLDICIEDLQDVDIISDFNWE